MMNVTSWLGRDFGRSATLAVVLFALGAGCRPENTVRPDLIRPVKTLVVSAGSDTRTRSFPGRVDASRRAELAFQVAGLLVELPVREGQRVAAGDLIAQLRRDEFQARLESLQGQLDQARAALRALQAGERPEERLRRESQVRAARAQLANARSEFERNSQLLQAKAISREQTERSEAVYQVAQEELKAAEQLLEIGTIAREEDIEAKEAAIRGLEGRVVEANLQLSDAALHAPYDGVIAQRFVEPNQNVTAKQAIVKFQDVDEIEILVDVPETIMAADLRQADIVETIAEFSAAPGLQFPVEIREIAQRADPVTQTFQVRAIMRSPPDLNLLPGMTAAVALTYRRANILGNPILVPIAAVSSQPQGAQIVWVVGADQSVSPRPVKLGEATGGMVEITAGLQPGDRVAVAGVTFLRAGMKVRDLGNALGG